MADVPVHTAVSGPVERRRYVRLPRRMAAAVTPVDRFCVLYGGVAPAAARLGLSNITLYHWRLPPSDDGNGHNGYFPNGMEAEAAAVAAEDGWILPEGFLTEPGAFDMPERREGAA